MKDANLYTLTRAVEAKFSGIVPEISLDASRLRSAVN